MPSKAFFFFIYGLSPFQALQKGKMTTDFFWALGSIFLSQILKCKGKNMFAESGVVYQTDRKIVRKTNEHNTLTRLESLFTPR